MRIECSCGEKLKFTAVVINEKLCVRVLAHSCMQKKRSRKDNSKHG